MRAFLPVLSVALLAHADITIYTQVTFGTNAPTTTSTSALPTLTNPAAFDPTILTPPAPPQTPVGGANVVQLLTGGMPGLSAPAQGGYLGFSIELSVADQVLGKNGTFINVQLLNLFETISQRGGRCVVRIGGNSQETAKFFPEGLPNQQTIIKDKSNVHNPTDTPTLDVGIDLIYAMGNISSLTNTQWFIGAPFDTPANPRLGIAEYSERLLGDRLLGVQVGNEPDLFGPHGNRPQPYLPSDYTNEFQQFANIFKSDSGIQKQNSLVVPSTCCQWGVLDLANQTQFFDTFNDLISMIAIEHYPSDYCPNGQGGHNHDPQTEYNAFMSHTTAVQYGQAFPGVPEFAASIGKPLIMMETNTASCGGFPGFSDSFGAALWLIDATLALAVNNYTAALLHVGGQNTFYNPFTPPPGGLIRRGAQWTVGAPFYSALIVAELIGASNKAQVVDIGPNSGSEFTPGYAIYEDGQPVRAIFFNYITDTSGANDYTAQIAIDGSGVQRNNASPPEIYVRYFTTPQNSTNAKIPFFYANQTFGGILESNGIIQGTQDTQTIQCDQGTNLCSVKVPTPGAVVVYFTKDGADKSTQNGPEAPKTFATTVTSVNFHNTATIDAQVLATSNGYGGKNHGLGSTSFGSSNDDTISAAGGLRQFLPSLMELVAVVMGVFAVLGSGY